MQMLQNLWVIGLSHWKTPVDVREKFVLSKEQISAMIETAKQMGITSILPLSTCNRMEIYAITENPDGIIRLLFGKNSNEINEFTYIKNSTEAVHHLFKVTVGLDSQILGDAQITGQVREFLQIALRHNAIDAVLNRLAELSICAGKKIKTHAPLNDGAASIAHAAVKQAFVQKFPGGNDTVLVIGSGKMGRLTVKSLLKSIPAKNIIVINRTNNKASQFTDEFGVKTSGFDSLKKEIAKADFIFAATSSPHPIITAGLLEGENLSGKIFIDLSLPRNIEAVLPAVVVTLDQLADTDKHKKENYIRLAEQYIAEGMEEYYNWLHRYELAQKIKLEIYDTIFDNSLDEPHSISKSKFVDGITGKYLRHFEKSRNLAA